MFLVEIRFGVKKSYGPILQMQEINKSAIRPGMSNFCRLWSESA
jgi:hypothetical protein